MVGSAVGGAKLRYGRWPSSASSVSWSMPVPRPACRQGPARRSCSSERGDAAGGKRHRSTGPGSVKQPSASGGPAGSVAVTASSGESRRALERDRPDRVERPKWWRSTNRVARARRARQQDASARRIAAPASSRRLSAAPQVAQVCAEHALVAQQRIVVRLAPMVDRDGGRPEVELRRVAVIVASSRSGSWR